MRVNLLFEDYLTDKEKLYQDFIDDNMDRYISDERVDIDEVRPFPIYMASRNDVYRNERYKEAFRILQSDYMSLGRDLTLDKRFWDSLFFVKFRDYVLDQYPNLKKGYSYFKDIMIKKFNWENYIYKSVIFLDHLNQHKRPNTHEKYYDLFLNNLDMVNYIIKYPLTRNSVFLFQILDIIDRNDLSELVKKKIKHRKDLVGDQRYIRRVIYEFNKNYPVMMFPDMSLESIEDYFFEFLNMYHPTPVVKNQSEWETL